MGWCLLVPPFVILGKEHVEMAERISNFDRTLSNVAKMGAYYTDAAHCRDIGRLLRFPEEGVVDVLEPSCGDASAVLALLESVRGLGGKANVFGVEIQDAVAKETQKNPLLKKVICEDFFDAKIRFKNKGEKFSLIFGNPPYMEDNEDGKKERMEHKFLQQCTQYLSVGGLLVWVIPLRIYAEDFTLRWIMRYYDILHLWKFRESEWKKWGQIVLMARRKERCEITGEEVREYQSTLAVEKVPVLPSSEELDVLEKIEVPANSQDNVSIFEPVFFDEEGACSDFIASMPRLLGEGVRYHKRLAEPEFVSNTLRDPLVTLCDGHIAQAIACGEGAGLTGTPGVDLHLQRGVCEVTEKEVKETTDDEESTIARKSESGAALRVTSSSSIKMTLINPSGKIIHLM